MSKLLLNLVTKIYVESIMLNENEGGMKMCVCIRVGIRANKFLPFDLASGDLSIFTICYFIELYPSPSSTCKL